MEGSRSRSLVTKSTPVRDVRLDCVNEWDGLSMR
jgi:hypothetical protein